MACFLVTHHAAESFALDEFLALEKRALKTLPREIKWVMSWYLPQENKIVAHWDAPTEQAVRVALERLHICEHLPLLKIENAIELYPKRYAAYRHAHLSEHKRIPHSGRELTGAYGESIATLLQTRVALPHEK